MTINRRTFLLGAVAAAATLGAGLWAIAPASGLEIKVYKSASCVCCNGWIDHLRLHGFAVAIEQQQDVSPTKARLGVPESLASCHTARIGNYVVEGHVPAADIKRLLELQPEARGLAVPGMVVGSPGMEQGRDRDRFDVVLFGDKGNTVFARY